jgi:hypothetical protein
VTCPKCKARVGVMRDVVVVGTGAVHCVRCFVCGYWVQADSLTPSFSPRPGTGAVANGGPETVPVGFGAAAPLLAPVSKGC